MQEVAQQLTLKKASVTVPRKETIAATSSESWAAVPPRVKIRGYGRVSRFLSGFSARSAGFVSLERIAPLHFSEDTLALFCLFSVFFKKKPGLFMVPNYLQSRLRFYGRPSLPAVEVEKLGRRENGSSHCTSHSPSKRNFLVCETMHAAAACRDSFAGGKIHIAPPPSFFFNILQ